MAASILLVVLTAFQLAPTTPVSPQAAGDAVALNGAATKPPMPSGSAPSPAVKAPVDPAELFKQETRSSFWARNYRELGRGEWAFLAAYYGMRALFVIILMALAWTASAWAASALRAALASVKFDETLTIFLAK